MRLNAGNSLIAAIAKALREVIKLLISAPIEIRKTIAKSIPQIQAVSIKYAGIAEIILYRILFYFN